MNHEPIALTSLIKESISSGVKFLVLLGLVAMDEFQLAALLLVLDNFLALAAAIYQRRLSTPVANPVLLEGTRVTVVTPPGEPNRTETL